MSPIFCEKFLRKTTVLLEGGKGGYTGACGVI